MSDIQFIDGKFYHHDFNVVENWLISLGCKTRSLIPKTRIRFGDISLGWGHQCEKVKFS